ncbi:ABC transporter ATP-binding protein [Acetonema longum]|uniref:ABC transporter n=1 Tax=Acetonema longum DSM 6540 TaxID=1009370 RepID=F7NI18_9FIRM|nr:ABC transporter ATP-binding protein [Acetonema longum]EGO64325.1 ABC transporter [Acetonema longum DSM 6540]
MLKLSGIVAKYGNITALKGIDLEVPAGSVVSLIGANGAGKSTTMKTITGLMQATEGQITFCGQEIKGLAAHQTVSRGISLVPEGRQILGRMTVLENLMIGACQRRDNEIQADIRRLFDRFPILGERREQTGGTLSGGQQQMLAIGRALMARPKLLLLDEPSMGLAPLVVADIFRIIREINQEGVTILLVEQNVRQALKVADYAYVMETGKIILHGKTEEIIHNPRVVEAYLGGKQQPAQAPKVKESCAG